jgi:zinc transport system permease protein
VRALLAVILVSLICGAVGSLVVGNRMSFFSDALAHCAFAGVGLGLYMAILAGPSAERTFYDRAILPVMIVFGTLVGLGIAYVRERTALANDTVIGVFFAGAMGFGAMVMYKVIHSGRQAFDLENFLFGNPLKVFAPDIIVLFVLLLVTLALLAWMYNQMLFTSFNPSLARSRRIRVRTCNYLFIVLLACIVNICLWTVGALLINALLIVPAATAANVSRNMRQMFWLSILLALGASIGGQLLSWEWGTGSGGPIVVLSVSLFFLSMLAGPVMRGKQVGA